MDCIGAAIIGCGAIFPLHAKAIAELEGVKLVAVVDTVLAKAEEAGATYGCAALTDYQAILDRPDIQVVHVCAPHNLHAEIAIACLKAGKHVLTEKPMAENLEAAYRMVETAEQSRGQLGITFQNRYNDSSVRIKETIDSGVLGKLLCMKGIVTWYRDDAYYRNSPWRGKWTSEGGGVLINQTIHTLDLLQWFGGPISSVKGSVTTDVLDQVIEVEDTAHACIDFANGARGLFYGTNAYLVNSPVELELVFEKGTLIQRRDSLYLWQDGIETLLTEPSLNPGGEKSYWGMSHGRLIADFYAHVRENKPFWLNGAEGIKALELIFDIYRSASSRQNPAPDAITMWR
ncbi:MAG: Gfo/Idh/MocA family oxidoreductase [Gorillibacterium sp.]|nr:Gfo/Idh/MocA family oxidoreductase [Gorillibacterium sp.]